MLDQLPQGGNCVSICALDIWTRGGERSEERGASRGKEVGRQEKELNPLAERSRLQPRTEEIAMKPRKHYSHESQRPGPSRTFNAGKGVVFGL